MRNVDSVLRDQAQTVKLPPVLCSGGQEVNSGRLNGRMPQYICQFHDIPAGMVKSRGK